jgi:hypothetical protein
MTEKPLTPKQHAAEAKRLAKKFPHLYDKPEDLSEFLEGEKQRLEKLHGPKGEVIYVVTEYNVHYGDLMTRFQIDGNRLTTVEDRCWPGKMVWCNACNGLGGVRPFERNDLTYEFLYKPLDLIVDPATVPSTGAGTDPETRRGGWDKLYVDFYFFCQTLLRAGGRHDSRDLSWLLTRDYAR